MADVVVLDYAAIANDIGQVSGEKPYFLNAESLCFKLIDISKHKPEVLSEVIGEVPAPRSTVTRINLHDDPAYLIKGLSQADLLAKLIKRHLGKNSHLNILDFGCGAGRIVRFLCKYWVNNQYAACDVNRFAVEHTQSVCGTIDARTIPTAPPSTYETGQFDAIYAWSIWTHHNEKLARLWLEELHRILSPGGIALITLHTKELVYRYGKEPEMIKRLEEKNGDYETLVHDFELNQFHYWQSYDKDKCAEVGIDHENFGMAFFSLDYVRTHWGDLFELQETVTGAPGWQDVLVLKRR